MESETKVRWRRIFLLLALSVGFFAVMSVPRASAQQPDSAEPPAAVQDDQNPSEQQPAPLPEGGEGEAQAASDSQSWGPGSIDGLGPDYLVGPEDVLFINVFDVKELSGLQVRVANDGSISVPLLGVVKVAGLTAQQVREKLENLWGESYLENPQVSVFVRQFRARPVSVIGAVGKPGLYPLTARRTLIDVLSIAGGLGSKTSVAAGRSVIITRKSGFADLPVTEGMHLLSQDKVEIDLSRLLYSSDDSTNIEIKPLDVISVTKAPVIYVVGEVKKAGGFVLEDRDKVTVLQALALAEGFFGNPSKKYARIIRREPNGQRQEIPVNLGKIMKGKAPDVEMAANDILFVPMSAGKAAIKQATSSAVATISGLVIWGRF